ncbi:hypothetical protein E0Z06_13390 [Rheinheimera sp. D18]|uniref:amidohydrolase family protein n=2 Tax=Rheinheimera TaxID=67575 RepID=UPI001051BC57|nr:amidohydrolase family protein [Rheinheimera sp. D18]QBL10451.1 hypothetical protein E0Z06_13390 [Rheinheimera sp. D18]
MDIEIKNCNNITMAKVAIVPSKLNIKFAPNGTGKSTISKAIQYAVTGDEKALFELLPFKFRNENLGNTKWRIGRMAGETAAQTAERKQQYQLIAKQLPYLAQSGVLLLAGSDSAALNTYVYPAQALHDELALFQQAGLTPAQILRTATINGATFMGVQADYGSIATTKQADLLLLPANPLQDINAVKNIDTLIYGGKVYNRKALDEMLN